MSWNSAAIQRAPNRQRARLQIHVCPLEPQQFAAPSTPDGDHVAPRGDSQWLSEQRLDPMRLSALALAAPARVFNGLTPSGDHSKISPSNTWAAMRLLRNVAWTYTLLRSFNPFSAICSRDDVYPQESTP